MTWVRIEPRTPCKTKGVNHGLNRTATLVLFLVAAYLKLYIFKYEGNNKRLLKQYTKINKLTLINCKNMTLCIFLIVIYG